VVLSNRVNIKFTRVISLQLGGKVDHIHINIYAHARHCMVKVNQQELCHLQMFFVLLSNVAHTYNYVYSLQHIKICVYVLLTETSLTYTLCMN